MMIAVAVIAVGLWIATEFSEGVPPKFVIRSIPARIGRLRPGMTREQVEEILGLRTSWVWGGLGTKFVAGYGMHHHSYEHYELRKNMPVSAVARAKGQLTAATSFRSTATIQLVYRVHMDPNATSIERQESGRLVDAKFSLNNKTVAQMPKP
jgi:hypothetical protein